MVKNLLVQKLGFYLFPKSHLWLSWLSFSLIITSGLNIPVWSQTKDDNTKISINPQVIQDKITLRVKVKKDNKLQSNLKEQDFSVYVDCKPDEGENCQPINLEDWRNPKRSTPIPTRIVVLLDLSGSMKDFDQGGKRKLQGAIDAIKQFTEALVQRGGDTKMVIVPFSDKVDSKTCEDDPVTNVSLERLAPADSPQQSQDIDKLQNDLNQALKHKTNIRGKYRLCGATNLYSSLATTINFLSNLNQKEGNSSNDNQDINSGEIQPKLHIVILSDGFNTVPFVKNISDKCDPRHFDRLKTDYLEKLHKNLGKITIHTIGYGRTPAELAKDPNYAQVLQGNPAKCTDIEKFEKFRDPEISRKFASELVDEEHLKEIADLTGGIHEFSANSTEIAQKFQDILDTIIGEYQMTYIQKDVDTADQHNIQVVVAGAGSEKASYSMPFVFRVPFSARIPTIFICIFLPLGLSILLIYLLGEEIKKQAQ